MSVIYIMMQKYIQMYMRPFKLQEQIMNILETNLQKLKLHKIYLI